MRRGREKPEVFGEALLALVGGVEVLMAYGAPAGITAVTRTILRMLRPPVA
jgi:hypothetical protein